MASEPLLLSYLIHAGLAAKDRLQVGDFLTKTQQVVTLSPELSEK